jgi:hypothetical protein
MMKECPLFFRALRLGLPRRLTWGIAACFIVRGDAMKEGICFAVMVAVLPAAAQTPQPPDPPPLPRHYLEARPTSSPRPTTTGPALDPPGLPVLSPELARRLAELRYERQSLTRDRQDARDELPRDDSTARERQELRQKIQVLVGQLASRPAAAPPAAPAVPLLQPNDKPADPMGLARTLIHTGDFETALRSFRLVDPDTLDREDRAFVQYMSAVCLRRMGKRSEAAALYREVADAKDDSFLAECAIWQIASLRWLQEAEAQLEDSRRHRLGR